MIDWLIIDYAHAYVRMHPYTMHPYIRGCTYDFMQANSQQACTV